MSKTACGKANSGNTPSDKDFSCGYCGKELGSELTLSRHKRTQHPDELDYHCPECGEAFVTRNGLISHDAQLHDGELAGIDRECPICGDEFTTVPAKDNQYCSRECGIEAQRKQVELSCEVCGDTFSVCESIAEERRHCSRECKGKTHSKEFSGDSHPRWKPDTHTTKECEYCGDEFEIARCELENEDKNAGRFCSHECHDEWRSENWVGENNPLYKGGDTYYGENWLRQSRKVRERDNHTCQVCGLDGDDYYRQLSVHHITPLRDFDEPEDANDLDNLITLCAACHQKWEGLYLRPDNRGGD